MVDGVDRSEAPLLRAIIHLCYLCNAQYMYYVHVRALRIIVECFHTKYTFGEPSALDRKLSK